MRKAFYSIALAALAAMTFSTAQAQDEQPQVRIEDQTELTCDKYTIQVPEGWTARSRMVGRSCAIGYNESPYTTASPNLSYNDIEGFKRSRLEDGYEALDDITIGDVTYSVFFIDNNGSQKMTAATPCDDRAFEVTLLAGSNKMEPEELKEALLKNLNEILEAVTLK